MSESTARILVFSGDATKCHAVITGVGHRALRNSALIGRSEAATPFDAKGFVESHDFVLPVLGAETQKEGGMSLVQELKNTMEDVPPIVFLTARQQDDWLTSWTGGATTTPDPLDPPILQETIAQLLENAGRVSPRSLSSASSRRVRSLDQRVQGTAAKRKHAGSALRAPFMRPSVLLLLGFHAQDL